MHTTPDVEQDLDKFFDLLSTTLKKEVLFKIHKKTLDKIVILTTCDSVEKSFIISHLKIAIFMQGDDICRQGEEGDELYFINKGVVKVSIEKIDYKISNKLGDEGKIEQVVPRYHTCVLHEGNYFGEVALISRLKRTASVKAIKNSTLSTMSRKVLQEAKKEYPQIYLSLKSRLNVYADPEDAKRVGVYNDFDF